MTKFSFDKVSALKEEADNIFHAHRIMEIVNPSPLQDRVQQSIFTNCTDLMEYIRSSVNNGLMINNI